MKTYRPTLASIQAGSLGKVKEKPASGAANVPEAGAWLRVVSASPLAGPPRDQLSAGGGVGAGPPASDGGSLDGAGGAGAAGGGVAAGAGSADRLDASSSVSST